MLGACPDYPLAAVGADELDGARQQIVSALLAVAGLEQDLAGRQLPDLRLLGERGDIFSLEPVERCELPELLDGDVSYWHELWLLAESREVRQGGAIVTARISTVKAD